jgi:hypothetical protein
MLPGPPDPVSRMERTLPTTEFLFFCITSLVRLVPGVALYEVIYRLGLEKLGVSRHDFLKIHFDDLFARLQRWASPRYNLGFLQDGFTCAGMIFVLYVLFPEQLVMDFSDFTDVFKFGHFHTSGTVPVWIIYIRLCLFSSFNVLCQAEHLKI